MNLTPQLIQKFDDAAFGFTLEIATPKYGLAVYAGFDEFVYGPAVLDFENAAGIYDYLTSDPRTIEVMIVCRQPNGEYVKVDRYPLESIAK